jgi:hypothetical protein
MDIEGVRNESGQAGGRLRIPPAEFTLSSSELLRQFFGGGPQVGSSIPPPQPFSPESLLSFSRRMFLSGLDDQIRARAGARRGPDWARASPQALLLIVLEGSWVLMRLPIERFIVGKSDEDHPERVLVGSGVPFGHAGRGVSEGLRDDLDWDACGRQARSKGMPEIVSSESAGDLCNLFRFAEVPCECRNAVRPSALGQEDRLADKRPASALLECLPASGRLS